MSTKPIRVLLVEDNPGDARLIKEMLAEAEGWDFSIEWVSRLADGLEYMSRDQVDVVLLDLGLPDSQGLDTFIKAQEQAPHVPFVVLTGLADETLALTALRQGAQDYLFKDEIHPDLLLRAIRYATERKEAELAIRDQEEQLAAIYDNAPLIMMLVDGEQRVRKANKLAVKYAGDLTGRRAGEALSCLYVLDDHHGCGFGPHCQNCPVRQTISDTLESGLSHYQVEATRPLVIAGKPHEITFLLCTARLSVLGEPQVLVTIQDISQRKHIEEALRRSEENLRYLATQLLHAQEGERLRIAHELHDDLGQSLMLLKLQLSIMARGLPPEPHKSRDECGAAIENVKEIIDRVRLLSHGLIPPTLADIGLKSAINDLLEEFSRLQGIDYAVDIDDPKGLLSMDTKLIIYRILQESLTNIGKYAQATQVSISLKKKDHQMFLSVEDNGRGFEVKRIMARQGHHRGLGLASMEERARIMGGTFHIRSAPDNGTRIQVTVPLRK